MKTKISELMEKLNLVQEMGEDNVMVVEGTKIPFATPSDELTRYLIAEIPNLFRVAKMCAYVGGLDNEEKQAIQEDGRAYISQLEALGEVYLNESELKCLISN